MRKMGDGDRDRDRETDKGTERQRDRETEFLFLRQSHLLATPGRTVSPPYPGSAILPPICMGWSIAISVLNHKMGGLKVYPSFRLTYH